MPQATLYVRYSPRPAKEGEEERRAALEDEQSIKCQIEECTRYCERKGLEIVAVLKDPETSARKVSLFDRDAGALLQDLPPGHHIVALDIDRMFRETADGLLTMRFFAQNGISLHFANQGGNSIDASTADGELFLTIRLGFAAYEPRKIAERTRRGMKHRQSEGELMGHPNFVKFGTRYDKKLQEVVADPEELEAMQAAVNMKRDGFSLRSIGRELKDQGLVRDGNWNAHPYSVSVMLNRAKEAGINPA